MLHPAAMTNLGMRRILARPRVWDAEPAGGEGLKRRNSALSLTCLLSLGPSLLERDDRDRPQDDGALCLMDLEKRFAFEAERPSCLCRKGDPPVGAHGNYASHATRSIACAIDRLPLDPNVSHALISAVVMGRDSGQANQPARGIATFVAPVCTQALLAGWSAIE